MGKNKPKVNRVAERENDVSFVEKSFANWLKPVHNLIRGSRVRKTMQATLVGDVHAETAAS